MWSKAINITVILKRLGPFFLEVAFLKCFRPEYKDFLLNPILNDKPAILTHWGRVTHICVSKQTIIGSDNGLSPGRRQAIIWTNAGILWIGTLGTNFSDILSEIRIFSFKKMGLNVSSAKWWTFCIGLNVLSSDDLLVELKHYTDVTIIGKSTVYSNVCSDAHKSKNQNSASLGFVRESTSGRWIPLTMGQ